MIDSHFLIDNPAQLRPGTLWSDTIWAWTSEESLIDHATKPRLCSAVLLPFLNGQPDWQSFISELEWQYAAASHYAVELVPVLNADTGYIFDLSDEIYAQVLQRFRQTFPDRRFIAGVTARGAEADSEFHARRYLPLLDLAQQHDNCEVLLMTSQRLNALGPERRRDGYFQIAEYLVRPGLVHALEPAFVSWATPYEPWLLWQLANHPKFVGGKISTLDEPHFLYWAAMLKSQRVDFIPHSGDDFGIATAIKLGFPLLIGAASSAAPLVCAAIDMWLDNSCAAKKFRTNCGRFDTRVYKLFEALQSLTDQVFRLDASGSAGAYKHSTAHVLHDCGIITSPEPHPSTRDRRPDQEAERMTEALHRPRRIADRLGIAGLSND